MSDVKRKTTLNWNKSKRGHAMLTSAMLKINNENRFYPFGIVSNDIGDGKITVNLLFGCNTFPFKVFVLYNIKNRELVPATLTKVDENRFVLINHIQSFVKPNTNQTLKGAILMVNNHITKKQIMNRAIMCNHQQFKNEHTKPLFSKNLANGIQLTQSEVDRLLRKTFK